ncbi:MAG: histidine--tRNA ligase [Clostridia bacterium]|nr:histidine--tRNA ligase [Clostridia bacterium]
MAETIKAIRGTNDVLPGESRKWRYVENALFDAAALFGFEQIIIPVFEHTEVFSRGVGDTTDVVQKEMYTFDDRGGRSITLRPEFTAGVMRSLIEHGAVNGALPVKVCYAGGCYRYEKPQAGRLREFHQFGIECVGAGDCSADAEVIALANHLLTSLGLKNIALKINSIGCPTCRMEYYKALKAYFAEHTDKLCGTCNERLDRNPMRILDCKSPICSEIAQGAPAITDYLCDDCKAHFEGVQAQLKAMDIDYTIDTQIVRGLDYYTRTVFEFISGDLGSQSTVLGGGRYDGLLAQLGGPSTPAVGFAMGLERLMMIIEAQNITLPSDHICDIYIAPMGDAAHVEAARLCKLLRCAGFTAECDIVGRGLKAQMRYANKLGATYTLVLGDSELENRKAVLKEMESGNQTEIELNDSFAQSFGKIAGK